MLPISKRLSLVPTAKLNGLVTGSKSPAVEDVRVSKLYARLRAKS